MYGGIISISLFGFATYQILYLALGNIASNESIRDRWNAHPQNKQNVKIFSDKSTKWQKLKYFLFSELPASRLYAYA